MFRANTPKIDVLRYCTNQSTDVKNNLQIPDRNSFALLWDLLKLFVRSNDNAEGHDFAELLLGSKMDQETPDTDEIDVTSDRSIITEPSTANSAQTLRNITTGRGYSEAEKVNTINLLSY